MNKYGKRILLASVIIVLIVILAVYGLESGFRLSNLIDGRNFVYGFSQSHLLYAVLIYILIVILFTAIFSPGIVILTLAGGYLFGIWLGGFAANIGITLGSILAFLSARYLLHDLVRYKLQKPFATFDKRFHKEGRNYLLFVRITPVVPSFIINLLAGLTKVKLWTFVWTTSLGNLPADLIFAYAGSEIKQLSSYRSIFTPEVLIALLLLVMVSLIPIWLRGRALE